MKRETRSLRYDNDPQEVTRRDLAPAPLRFGEQSSPASSLEPLRELKPYPALRPHADDATVKYALVQDASRSRRDDGERPSDLPSEFRSGTRVTPTSTLPPTLSSTASTTPPASHVQARAPVPPNARIPTPLPANARITTPLPANARIATPLPRSDQRYATSSVSFAPPPKPLSTSLPAAPHRAAPAPGPSMLGLSGIALLTIILAAFVGATLGDGAAERLWARFSGDVPKPAPAAVAPQTRTAAPSPAPAATTRSQASVEHAAPAATLSSPPAVRFEDLPSAEPATNVDVPAALARKPMRPTRHR